MIRIARLLPLVGALVCLCFQVRAMATPATVKPFSTEVQKIAPGSTSIGRAHENLGYSVACDGDTMVLGAPFFSGGQNNQGRALVYVRSIGDWALQAILVSDTPQAYDFGSQVAISGDTIVVRASQAQSVFVRTGTTWTLQTKLPITADCVALSGDTLILGISWLTPKKFGSSIGAAGGARVFTRTAGIWTEQDEIFVADAQAGDRAGTSLAISGDTLVIGAQFHKGWDLNTGMAVVFKRSGTTWTQTQVLEPLGRVPPNLYFGGKVAISGDTIAVGCEGLTVGTISQAGAVFVYTNGPSGWSQQAKITMDASDHSSHFGSRGLALAGDHLIAGNHDYCYAFSRTGTAWARDTIVSPDSNLNRADGDSAFFSDPNELWISIPSQATSTGDYSGALHGFQRSPGQWNWKGPLDTGIAHYKSQFGHDVAVDGDTAAVGAPGAFIDNEHATGSVTIYGRGSDGNWEKQTELYPPGGNWNIQFGHHLALQGDTLAVTAPKGGLTYVYARNGGVWTLQAQLTTNADDATSVALDGETLLLGHSPQRSVDVFTRSSGAWTQSATLPLPSDLSRTFDFGYSLALKDGTAYVGAPSGYDNTGRLAGGVFVYQFANGGWTLKATLRADKHLDVDAFGESLCLDGGTLAIAGTMVSAVGFNNPAAWVYEVSAGDITFKKLLSSNLKSSDGGAIVKVRAGTLALAGGLLEDYHCRAADLYQGTASTMQWRGTIASPETAETLSSLALDGNTLLMGQSGTRYSDTSGDVHVMGFGGLQLLDGATPLVNDASLSLGGVLTGKSLSRTITVKNTGIIPLPHLAVSLDGQDASAFSVTQPSSTSLEPGATTTFTVSFSSGTEWTPKAVLLVTTSAMKTNEARLQISAFANTKPVLYFTSDSNSDVTADLTPAVGYELHYGTPQAVFHVAADGTGAIRYQWLKNGAAIPGATAGTLDLGEINSAAKGGIYSARVTTPYATITSNPVTVSVIRSKPVKSITVCEGAPLLLTSDVVAGRNYQWIDGSGNGITISDGGGTATSTSATLRIAHATRSTIYNCFLPATDLTVGSPLVASYDVTVILRPSIWLSTDEAFVQVGQAVDKPLSIANSPENVEAIGLPPGLTLKKVMTTDPFQGGIFPVWHLCGNPRQAGSYRVLFSATNAAGRSVPFEYPLTVAPLPTETTGAFVGLVGTSDYVPLGGAFSLQVASDGSFTGRITLGATIARFTGRLVETYGHDGITINPDSREGHVALGKVGNLPGHLFLDFTISAPYGEVGGFITTDSDWSNLISSMYANRIPWTQKTPFPRANAGRFAFLSSNYDGDGGYSGGGGGIIISGAVSTFSATNTSTTPLAPRVKRAAAAAMPASTTPTAPCYGSLVVSPNGAATASYHLTDGSVVTSSGSLDFSLTMPVYALTFSNRGMIQMQVGLTQNAAGTDMDVAGGCQWVRPALVGRLVPGGFSVPQTLKGGRYRPPASGQLLFGVAAVPDNAWIKLESAASDTQSVICTITTHGITVPTGIGPDQTPLNPSNIKLTITPSTGVFNGSATFTGPSPSDNSKTLKRPITFSGQLLPTLRMGGGFFLVPQLPNANDPKSTLLTTPIEIGAVTLKGSAF